MNRPARLANRGALDPHVERAGDVAGPELGGLAHVEDARALVQGLAHLRRPQRTRIAARRHGQRPVARDDALEVGRLGGQPRHERLHEVFLVAGLEGRVEPSLEADRGGRLARHGAPAARARPVGRVHLHAVGEREETPGEAPVEPRRGLLAAEIRPAHVPHEQRVPGEDEPRLGAAREIGHEQRDALRRVAGRVQDPEGHVAETDLGAVLDGAHGERGVRGRMQVDRRPRAGGERLVARDVVRVDVGLDDVGEGHTLLAGQGDVVVDAVTGGIDQSGLPALPAADQVGEATLLFVDDLLEDHRADCPTAPENRASAVHRSPSVSSASMQP